jgi:formamidase
MALPEGSEQNPIVALCPSDVPGVTTRLRPFLGHVGTTPSIDMPDSHNAGGFGTFLVDAPHEYGITTEQHRVTISGAVEIGRLPRVVTVTMLAPLDRLEKGLAELVKEQYGL